MELGAALPFQDNADRSGLRVQLPGKIVSKCPLVSQEFCLRRF